MRLDRLITLGVVKPVGRALGRYADSNPVKPGGVGAALPVLMYHSISDDPEPTLSPYYKVCTAPRRFAEHLQWMAENGWLGVTLSDGLDFLAGRKQFNARPVAITFDDGFRDFHTAAFPALQQHGFSATMYLPTAYIASERTSFKSRECLTWAEVKALQAAGMEFGSHTVTHPKLVELDWPQISTELKESKKKIEEQLELPVRSFAYPYAFPLNNHRFARRFQIVLREAGYESSVTTEIGRMRPGDDPLKAKRQPANSCDDKSLLLAKLSGAYDWVRRPQGIVKHLKSLRLRRPASPS